MLGLFRGVPGARAFRRLLATEAVKPGAGTAVLTEALAQVMDTPADLAHIAGVMFGIPIGELLFLAAVIVAGGIVTGILAGLFGIGGGAIIVPVLYEVFRVLDVPEEVRMQLCVGTSMAIIVPTNVRSYLVHRRYGAVLMDVVRAWALPSVVGVAVGALIAGIAPGAVLKIAFVVITGTIGLKLLIGRDDWRIANALPGRVAMTIYGFILGLGASLIGVSGGSISAMILTLYGTRDPQRGRDLRRARGADHHRRRRRLCARRAAAAGADAAVVDRLRVADRLCADGAGRRAMTAPFGARLAHALPKRRLEIAFAAFLLARVAAASCSASSGRLSLPGRFGCLASRWESSRCIAAAIVAGGVVAGLLAGVFGVGGGVIAVPVLYEVFRILGVPDAVHMQLCIGTSLAIMAPTNIRSYLTHRATGAVLTDVVRQWTPGVIVGIAIGSLIATVAPSPVFKIAFIVIAGIIAGKLLFAQERWRLGDDLPKHPLARLYGLAVGLMASLTGVSGGSLCTMVLTLYGKPIHQAVATSAGIVVPITLAGTRRLHARRPAASGAAAAAVDRLRVADRLCADGAGVESLTAPYGAKLAHAMSQRALEIAFGLFLLAASLRFLVEPGVVIRANDLGIRPQHQPVAADLPAFQAVEEAHAEQALAQLSRLRDQRGHVALHDAADADGLQRHRCGAGAPVGGVDRRPNRTAPRAAAPPPWPPHGSARPSSRRCRRSSARARR